MYIGRRSTEYIRNNVQVNANKHRMATNSVGNTTENNTFLLTWISSYRLERTVIFALPLTTNATSSPLQTFRVWIAMFRLRPPLAFVSHSLNDMPGLSPLMNIFNRAARPSHKLVRQGYVKERFKSSLRKLCARIRGLTSASPQYFMIKACHNSITQQCIFDYKVRNKFIFKLFMSKIIVLSLDETWWLIYYVISVYNLNIGINLMNR